MQEIPKITWLPAHPAEGSQSMDRYWRDLEGAVKQTGTATNLEVFCPLGKPPTDTQRAGRFQRIFQKYLVYPLQCQRLPQSNVVHLLDHSYAHLLKYLPPHQPVVATLHDVAPLIEPGDLSEAQIERFRRACMELNRAELILCVSESTRNDAIRLLGLTPQKLKIHPMGVDFDFFRTPHVVQKIRQALKGSPTLLSVGTIQSRKNLQLLPAIFSHLVAKGLQPMLWRAGQSLPEGLRNEIKSILGHGRLIEFGRVNNEELAALYQNADVFLMPSTLEGFGLPVIEAMAAGCPVVCSTGGSLAEVAGGAALLFDPSDAEQAAAHLTALAGDPQLRESLREKGRLWSQSLSWKTHLEKLIQFYQSAQNSFRPKSIH